MKAANAASVPVQQETQKPPRVILKNFEEYDGQDPCVVRLSDDFAYVAIGFSHGRIIIKENTERTDTKKTIGSLNNIGEFNAEDDSVVTDIRFVHINQERKHSKLLCATYASGHVRLWRFTRDIKRRMQSEVLEEYLGPPRDSHGCNRNTPLCCSFSYNNKHIVVGGADTVIRVYEAETLKLLRKCKCSNIMGSDDGHLMQICAISYHPLGATLLEYIRVFISASWDKTIKIWQDDFERCYWSYNYTSVFSNDALDICPTSNVICAGNWSTDLPAVSIFNFNTTIVHNYNSQYFKVKSFSEGRCFDKSITKLAREAFSLPSRNYVTKLLDDRTVLMGGGNVNRLNIIDIKSGEALLTVSGFKKSILSAAVLKRGKEWYPCSVCLCCDNTFYALTIIRPGPQVLELDNLMKLQNTAKRRTQDSESTCTDSSHQ